MKKPLKDKSHLLIKTNSIMYKVGIIGCGGIFPRHIEAIESNSNFELIFKILKYFI